MLYPLRFIPVFKNYVWGGHALARFGKTLIGDGVFAESWEVTAHRNGVSIVANGPLATQSLPDLLQTYGKDLIGTTALERDLQKFPLLIKLLDARIALPIQVHPDDAYAAMHENGEYGKNEMWYVVSAEPGATIVVGLKPGYDRDSLRKVFAEGRSLEAVNIVPVVAGDVVNVPSGMIHAIGAGLLICEVQQNSDTTYMIDNYGRLDVNGQPRLLHFEKSLDVIDFSMTGPDPRQAGLMLSDPDDALQRRALVMNRYFLVEEWLLNGFVVIKKDPARFRILTALAGSGVIHYLDDQAMPVTESVQMGDTIFLPAAIDDITITGASLLMIQSRPSLFETDLNEMLQKADRVTVARLVGLRPEPDGAAD